MVMRQTSQMKLSSSDHRKCNLFKLLTQISKVKNLSPRNTWSLSYRSWVNVDQSLSITWAHLLESQRNFSPSGRRTSLSLSMCDRQLMSSLESIHVWWLDPWIICKKSTFRMASMELSLTGSRATLLTSEDAYWPCSGSSSASYPPL